MDTQTQGPLWDDARINKCIKDVLSDQPNHTPRGLARRVAYTVRDEMQAQIAMLEQQLADARTRLSGTEAAWDDVEQMMLGEDGDDE